MFFPVGEALEEVPEIINIQGGGKQFLQIKPIVNVIVIKEDDIPKSERRHGLTDVSGEAAVIEIVDQAEEGGTGQPIDGFYEGAGIIFPDIRGDTL